MRSTLCLSALHCWICVLGMRTFVQAPQGDAVILFMWQDDIIGVARFIDACLHNVFTSAGPPVGEQASDQP